MAITLGTLDSPRDDDLARVFKWQTACRLGPAFGSIPIGWFQQHHIAVIKVLEDLARNRVNPLPKYGDPDADNYQLKCSGGDIYLVGKAPIKGKVLLGSVREIHREADKRIRR